MSVEKSIIIFDTETSGLPICCRYKEYPHPSNLKAYDPCRLVQLSYSIYTHRMTNLIIEKDAYIYPIGFEISEESQKITGISNEKIELEGKDLKIVLNEFISDILNMKEVILIGHNVLFDINVIASELYRLGKTEESKWFHLLSTCCTMESTKNEIKIERQLKSGKRVIKDPSLKEAYEFYSKGKSIENQHNSLYDVRNTAFVYKMFMQY